MTRLKTFTASPEGRRVFEEARKLAKDPAARRRIEAARRNLAGKVPPSGR